MKRNPKPLLALHQYFLTNIKYLEDARFKLSALNILDKNGLNLEQNDILKLIEILSGRNKEEAYKNAVNFKTLNEIKKAWEKLKSGFPLDYILKKIEYESFTLFLEKGVFIPRPETEFGVELALKKYKNLPNLYVDLCCGSGLISLILSKNLPDSKIYALDTSKKALKTTQKNILKNGIKNVQVLKSNILEILPKMNDLKTKNWALFCNPPYVPKEWEESVKFEPKRAIYSGKDGLNFFKKLVKNLEKIENKPSFIWLELDPRNVETAKNILEQNRFLNFKSLEIYPDQFGVTRFLIGSNLE